MELKAVGVDTPPQGGRPTFQEEQMIPVFQELCALIYEPALLPLHIAVPQAISPVLHPSYDLDVGHREIQRGW